MITTAFLDDMYDKFIDSRELTTKELLSIGFTNKDLTRLKEKGKIASVKRGVYRLADVDGLFKYSHTLPRDRQYDCFKRCLEIDPKNTKYVLSVFNQSLWVSDFGTTLKCFDILDNPDYRKQRNLELLVLSYITDLGEKYRERLRNLTIDDITFDYCYVQMNASIYDADFKNALAITSHYAKSISNTILYRMLSLAKKEHKKRLDLYRELVDNRNYVELLTELSKEREIHPLGVFERNALLIVQDIVSMKETGRIKAVDFSDTADFEEAVRRGNYALALKLCGSINFSLNRSALCEMLKDALSYKRDLKEKKQLSDNLDFQYYLANGKLDKAFDSLGKCLLGLGQEKYYKYICLLTKLSVLNKDSSFEEVTYVYKSILAGDFKVDCSTYIIDFFNSLNGNDVERASVYLDIISNSEAFGGVSIDTSDMKAMLDRKISELGVINAERGAASKNILVDACFLDTIVTDSVEESVVDKPVSLQTVIDDVIHGDNLALLEPMDDEDISLALSEICKNKGIISFVIGEGDKKQIVLKYKESYIDNPVGSILKKASVAYLSGDFDRTIELYETALPLLLEPRFFIYDNLGRAYYNRAENNDWHDAIDYLTLANAYAKRENRGYDYTELVNKLKASTGYNGIRVNLDRQKDNGDTDKSGAVQYVKKD